uniref:Uncharacterized protein n=1 Tax=Triticum urartu TaxID=4572 RepID=A0A8R7UE39_TRIUA
MKVAVFHFYHTKRTDWFSRNSDAFQLFLSVHPTCITDQQGGGRSPGSALLELASAHSKLQMMSVFCFFSPVANTSREMELFELQWHQLTAYEDTATRASVLPG